MSKKFKQTKDKQISFDKPSPPIQPTIHRGEKSIDKQPPPKPKK